MLAVCGKGVEDIKVGAGVPLFIETFCVLLVVGKKEGEEFSFLRKSVILSHVEYIS